MNHRFLLRLVTNIAFVLLTFSCLGIVLWVIDEFLQWDILPEAISILVQALLVAGGIIAFVLMLMNVLLSLTLIAEANASQANLPDYGVSVGLRRRVRQSIVVAIALLALLLGGLQITNHLRAKVATKEAETQFIQTQADMDQSMAQVLGLFTPPLLDGLASNTLTEKGQLGNTAKLFDAVTTSFPHAPAVTLIVPATQAPYQYARISRDSIKQNTDGKVILSPDLYATFPEQRETEAIEQLFAETLPTLSEPLTGQIINNTVPSSWGILKQNGKAIAVVYLSQGYGDANYGEPSYSSYINPYVPNSKFHHDGPDNLLTN